MPVKSAFYAVITIIGVMIFATVEWCAWHGGKVAEVAMVEKTDALAAASSAQLTQRWDDNAQEAKKNHDAEVQAIASAVVAPAHCPVRLRSHALAAVLSHVAGEAHSVYSPGGIIHDDVLSQSSASLPIEIKQDLAEAARADRLAADCRQLDAAWPK